MNQEIWKDIPGYEGMYQVSNFGRVKSFKGRISKILKNSLDRHGYLRVNLCFNNKVKTCKIHQLVAVVFLNHNQNGMKEVVDHINEIKTDNNVLNLRIVSQRQNTSRRKNTTSTYTGVHWNEQNEKWRAVIHFKGKQKHLGYFSNEHDAHLAYQKQLSTIIKTR
jgi:hypothetical protein